MSTAVLVPWGTDHGHRERLWNRIRPMWETTGCDLVIAADPLFSERGKFAVGRAINNAVRLAPPEYDRFVCFGADFLPCARTVEWAAAELDDQPWTLLFDRGIDIGEHDTDTFIATGDLPALDVTPTVFPTPCVGPIAFRRDTFDQIGGFDHRYEGWAYEDVDLWNRLQRDTPRSGPQTYPGTPLIQLWHPVTHHDLSLDNPNVALFQQKWC